MTAVDFQRNNNDCNVGDHQEPKNNDETLLGINNYLFSMQINENDNQFADNNGHEVTFNVTFAIAVPGVFTSLKSNEPTSRRISLSDQSVRNVQMFYHVEFDLFPKEITNDCNKTDVGFYGSFAKIYPDKSESKIVPTWTNGHETWLSWVQQYKVWITDHHIKSICNHKMKVFIWDTKDKCSSKVRFDRPKIPKSANKSKDTNENINYIKQSILTISREFSKTSSYSEDNDRILPHEILSTQPLKRQNQNNKFHKKSLTVKSSISSVIAAVKESEQLILLAEPKPETNDKLESYGQLEKLLESQNTLNATKIKTNCSSSKPKSVIENKKESIDMSVVDLNVLSDSRKSAMQQIHNDNYNKNGRTGLEINIPDLFLTNFTLNRIPNSVSSVEDMFCKVSIETEIVSSDQKKRLNPLVINIQKVKSLPVENNQIDEMNKKYKPVYCEYQFSDLQSYKTLQRLHKPSISFNDISVILLGEMSEIKIRKQFINSFFQIQLFNRIKTQETNDIEQNILDMDCSVNKTNIGDINTASYFTTLTNANGLKPQGEARIDLSDLINKNIKFLEVTVPIVPISPVCLRDDNNNNNKGKSQLFSEHVNFLEAETSIKVSFQLSELLSFTISSADMDEHLTKFLIINRNLSCDFIRETCANYILSYNCEKHCFKSDENSEMKQFLYSIKNSHISNEAFVGFFIIDGTCELLLVEGYRKNVKLFYEHCSDEMNSYRTWKNDSEDVKLFYNDSLLFEEKENFPLLTMIPLVLSKDITFFTSQPLLYVRDMLPKNCVEGICRLKQLVESESMQVIIRNNLIPTNQMINDLSQYLCSHIYPRSIDNENKKKEDEKNVMKKLSREQIKTDPVMSKRKINIMLNDKQIKAQRSVNFIYPSKECEFSYSSQSKNDISIALAQLRNQMDPKRRYTFSQEYLSATIDPVDLQEIYYSEERKLKNEKKWINKGHKTLIDDCSESNNLTVHRIEDLKEPWKENELHSSFMQPTLPERDNMSLYFDNYIRPLNLNERNITSVFPSYATQKKEEKQYHDNCNNIWKSKVCVANTILKTHRKLPQTELIEKGRTGSNQLDRLKGLRKDKLEMINWIVKKYDDPDSIPMISAFSNQEIKNQAYTVGSELNRHLSVNYIPVAKKDKDFKSYYQPSKESFIYKNPNPKIPRQNISPFSITCNH